MPSCTLHDAACRSLQRVTNSSEPRTHTTPVTRATNTLALPWLLCHFAFSYPSASNRKAKHLQAFAHLVSSPNVPQPPRCAVLKPKSSFNPLRTGHATNPSAVPHPLSSASEARPACRATRPQPQSDDPNRRRPTAMRHPQPTASATAKRRMPALGPTLCLYLRPPAQVLKIRHSHPRSRHPPSHHPSRLQGRRHSRCHPHPRPTAR